MRAHLLLEAVWTLVQATLDYPLVILYICDSKWSALQMSKLLGT